MQAFMQKHAAEVIGVWIGAHLVLGRDSLDVQL
jgi:hypothetical protein